MGLYNFFAKLKSGTEELNYGRHIFSRWGVKAYTSVDKKTDSYKILDLGCGHGTDLLNIQSAIKERYPDAKIELYGIECYEDYIRECRQKNIHIYSIDIEKSNIPAPDGEYDLVIANQVLEHTKEIFWIHSEVLRVTKTGGYIMYGVPNLASFHNRILLAFGLQPSTQQSLSAHVRTFTKRDLIRFAAEGGYADLSFYAGSNFYPLPSFFAKPLAVIFPSLAWGLFLAFKRNEKKGMFIDYLDHHPLETNYYRGRL